MNTYINITKPKIIVNKPNNVFKYLLSNFDVKYAIEVPIMKNNEIIKA